MTDPSTATAAITAVVFAALIAGHMLGDHPVQRDDDAQAKGHPTDDLLAAGVHPWTGWGHALRHCSTYLLTQAVTLALAAVVAPLTWSGALAALTISGATHAVIDRRLIVRAIIAAKGGCPGWEQASYWTDQSLHWGCIYFAAIAAAAVTTPTGTAVVAMLGAALIAGCLTVEQLRGTALAARPASTDRL